MTIRSNVILVLLLCLGFLGNYYTVPLFFGADFLFGSIAVLLVLYFYGLGWGLTAAVLVYSYTYWLWGHPYGFLNFVSEALFVGIFWRRGHRSLLVLDAVYWLLLGAPMVGLEHGVLLHMDATTTIFIMFKQAINGIFNALLVNLAICFLPLDKLFRRPQSTTDISFQESLFNLLVMMVLLPALLLTMLETRHAKENLEAGIVDELQLMSANLQLNIHFWFQQHLHAVQELARLALVSSMSPTPLLQHETEILKQTFPDFNSLHVENARGRTIAFAPPVNDKGESTLGHDFSDRSWFQESKNKKQPVVSELIHGRIGVFSPITVIAVPIIRDNQWVGSAAASLNLKMVQDMLKPYSQGKSRVITLADLQNQIIASTASEPAPKQILNRKKTGVSLTRQGRVEHWYPDDPQLPSMTRWKQSCYLHEISLGPELPWKLIIEIPVAPMQHTLYTIYARNLAIMALLTALALLFSLFLSRWLTGPLTQLSTVTADLPKKLTEAQSLDWPVSSASEINSLIGNVESMARMLELNYQSLYQEKEKYRILTEESPLGVAIIGRDGSYQYLNHKFIEIFGYTLEDIPTGKDWFAKAFPDPAYRQEVISDWLKDIGRSGPGESRPRTFTVTCRDGRKRIIHFRAVTLENRDQLVIYEDITESKKFQAALEESLSLYKAALDSTADGILVVSRHMRIVSANNKFRELWHIPEEIIASGDDEPLLAYAVNQLSDPPAFLAKVRELYAHPTEESFDLLHFKDGRVFERYSIPQYLDDQIVGRVWSFRDVTIRTRTEEALRQSEAKYRALLETTDTGYVIIDFQGVVLDANPEYARLTGHRTPEEIIGRNVVEWTAPHDRERNAAAVAACAARGFARHLEVDYLGPDGRIVPVEINATCITAGNVRKILSLVLDITDRKQSEAERLKLSNLESLATLAGGIAHDFNNILTAIMGNIGLAMLDQHDDEHNRERLSEAEKACLQAKALARQLLTFAKGGAPVKELISLEKIITESVSFTSRGSQVKGELSFADNLWAVEADPGQISQVCQNLVINAIQAMPTGGTIEVRGENLEVAATSNLPLDQGRYVKISLKDQGLGIPEEYLAKVFDPYFTTKQTGSGLGLATAHSIVKKHQGHIGVESQLGEGTIFQVYLPAAEQEPLETLQDNNKLKKGHGKILVMDDEAMVRKVLGAMLSRLGFEAKFASDGTEAIALFMEAQQSGQTFDAVILDLTVPGGMGGQETIQELIKINPRVKAIVSSGYAEDPIMAEFAQYGFIGVIAKPYKIMELSELLNTIIDRGK